MLISMLKYIKILQSTPTCFDFNRSSSGSSSVPGWSATHCTTRVTTYIYYMYCCHNTGIDRQDFTFSVF